MISRYLCQILYAIKKCNLLSDRCYLTTFLNGFVLRSSLQVLAVSQLKYEQFNLHKVSAVGGLVCGTVGFLGFFWCDWTNVSKCFGAVEPAGLFCVKHFATMQSPLQKQKKALSCAQSTYRHCECDPCTLARTFSDNIVLQTVAACAIFKEEGQQFSTVLLPE